MGMSDSWNHQDIICITVSLSIQDGGAVSSPHEGQDVGDGLAAAFHHQVAPAGLFGGHGQGVGRRHVTHVDSRLVCTTSRIKDVTQWGGSCAMESVSDVSGLREAATGSATATEHNNHQATSREGEAAASDGTEVRAEAMLATLGISASPRPPQEKHAPMGMK